MQALINKHGGSTAVSRKVPHLALRTVERWKTGEGLGAKWAFPLLWHWLENPPTPKQLARMKEVHDK